MLETLKLRDKAAEMMSVAAICKLRTLTDVTISGCSPGQVRALLGLPRLRSLKATAPTTYLVNAAGQKSEQQQPLLTRAARLKSLCLDIVHAAALVKLQTPLLQKLE